MNCQRWIFAILVSLALASAAKAEKVARIKVNGAIGPATASYISRGIHEAHAQDAQCLVIQLDTPGGLLESTKTIVQELLAAPLPTVVYVAPAGATATSAGCFITLAADIAAMLTQRVKLFASDMDDFSMEFLNISERNFT